MTDINSKLETKKPKFFGVVQEVATDAETGKKSYVGVGSFEMWDNSVDDKANGYTRISHNRGNLRIQINGKWHFYKVGMDIQEDETTSSSTAKLTVTERAQIGWNTHKNTDCLNCTVPLNDSTKRGIHQKERCDPARCTLNIENNFPMVN